MELLIQDSWGIYIPQKFVEHYIDRITNKFELEDELNDCGNPLNEFYWESWDTILAEAILEFHGEKYRLYQDNDLWAEKI